MKAAKRKVAHTKRAILAALFLIIAGLIPAMASGSTESLSKNRVMGSRLFFETRAGERAELTQNLRRGCGECRYEVALGSPHAPKEGTGANSGGMKALPEPTGPFADHHIFPRQFREFFQKRGIDIDKYTVTIDQNLTHLKAVHGRGNLSQMPGKWNDAWAKFIQENPNATDLEIYQQAGKLMDEYGLSGTEIHPYRK